MADKLVDLAKMLRSKNSGPFMITLDALFTLPETYFRVKTSGVINEVTVRKLYNLDATEPISIVFFDNALGIKITFNRKVSSGTALDRDVYGAQQHAPLMDLLIP